MISGSLPRRYARALFLLAEEEGKVEEIGRELSSAAKEMTAVPEGLMALGNRSFPLEERILAVTELASRGMPLTKNFLLLLTEKGRIHLIGDIAREFREMEDKMQGVVRVEVITPEKPGEPLLRKTEQQLSQKLNKRVIATGGEDRNLMGGVVIKAGHTVYDGSVRRALERIRERMAAL